jgi:hypothetical protein
MTRERTDATEAFYQAWVPNMTHIIIWLATQQTTETMHKMINVIISDGAKTLHFVG